MIIRNIIHQHNEFVALILERLQKQRQTQTICNKKPEIFKYIRYIVLDDINSVSIKRRIYFDPKTK